MSIRAKGPSLLALIKKENQPSPALKRAAVRLLGNAGSAKSMKALKGLASDKDAAISRAASEGMEKIKKREKK